MCKLFRICIVSFAVLLTGCAVPSSSELFSSEPEKDYSDVYLRGVFNWWEATEAFKFEPVDASTYSVEVELIADGQPYDFKVANSDWSPAYNCGLATQSTPLSLNTEVELYCFSDSLNLQFIPSETAIYLFELDVSNSQYPQITIIALN
jgi:hypothetical protein